MTFGRVLVLVLRLLSYLALAVLFFGLVLMGGIQASGVCPQLNEAGIQCTSPAAGTAATVSLGIFLVYAFTGVPALLALGGCGFLFYDAAALFRRLRGPR